MCRELLKIKLLLSFNSVGQKWQESMKFISNCGIKILSPLHIHSRHSLVLYYTIIPSGYRDHISNIKHEVNTTEQNQMVVLTGITFFYCLTACLYAKCCNLIGWIMEHGPSIHFHIDGPDHLYGIRSKLK